MQCDTLVLATMMHPCYRIHLFELAFGADSVEVTECNQLLELQFQQAKDQNPSAQEDKDKDITVIEKPSTFAPNSLMDRLTSRMTQQTTVHENEIESYMKAEISFKADDLAHKSTPLKWWKVSMAIIALY
jgi:hypothetical protein